MARGESGELTKRGGTDLVRRDHSADEERILQIRESMQESREKIAESLDQLRFEMQEAVDWRAWVEEHPWETVGIAFGVGFMIGFR